MPVQVETFSDRAVLVTGYSFPPTHLVEPLAAALHMHSAAASWRVQAGLTSLLVAAPTPTEGMAAVVDAALAGLIEGTFTGGSTHSHHFIPTHLDGEDLTTVLTRAHMSGEAFAQALASVTWQVAVFGFAPGFAYLQPTTILPWEPLPRLSIPRPLAPAGAVALADSMACIYPGTTPGGWQWIGTCTLDLFNPLTGQVWADIGDSVTFIPTGGQG